MWHKAMTLVPELYDDLRESVILDPLVGQDTDDTLIRVGRAECLKDIIAQVEYVNKYQRGD